MPESTEADGGVVPPDPGPSGAPSWDVRAALAPLERALVDAFSGRGEARVRVLTDAGDEDALPARLLLREPDDLLPLDRAAVARARGRVLDVGAGGGSVALALQAAGHRVTALEILPGAVEVMRGRGVADARLGDVWGLAADPPWDTVTVLMNGTGLAGTLARLPAFLARLAALTAPGGQVLVDSTDPGGDDRDDGRPPGELHYQVAYGGEVGPPFPWLLVAPDVLAAAAAAAGLDCEVVETAEGESYLARLVRTDATASTSRRTRPGSTPRPATPSR